MKNIIRTAEPVSLSFDVVGDYIYRSEWFPGVDMSSINEWTDGILSQNSSKYQKSKSQRINGFLRDCCY